MGSSNFFYLASNQRCLRVERNNWRGGAPKGTILELSFGICVNAATDGDISWRNSSVALIFWRHFSGTRDCFRVSRDSTWIPVRNLNFSVCVLLHGPKAAYGYCAYAGRTK